MGKTTNLNWLAGFLQQYLPHLEATFGLCAEANRIDAAFIRFDYSGSGTLDESELAAMPLGIWKTALKNRKSPVRFVDFIEKKIHGGFPKLEASILQV